MLLACLLLLLASPAYCSRKVPIVGTGARGARPENGMLRVFTRARILVVVMSYPIFSHRRPFIGANTH